MYGIRIYYAYLTDGQCQKRDRGRDPTKDTARSETEAETGETAKRCIHTHLYPHAHTQSYVHVFVSVIHMNVSSAHTYTPKTRYKHTHNYHSLTPSGIGTPATPTSQLPAPIVQPYV